MQVLFKIFVFNNGDISTIVCIKMMLALSFDIKVS